MTTTEGASPAPDELLDDLGELHGVLVRRGASIAASVVVRAANEVERLRKIEDRARSIVARKTCRCTTCRTAYRILHGESNEDDDR